MAITKMGYSRYLLGFLAGSFVTMGNLVLLTQPLLAQPAPTAQQSTATAQQWLNSGIQLGRQGTAQSLQQALANFAEAIRLSKVSDDKLTMALALLSSGRIYDILNQRTKALEAYNQALPLWQDLRDRSGEARTLNNIGTVYSLSGETAKALDYFNQSLPIIRELKDPIGEARTLNNIAWVYREQGQVKEAMTQIDGAIALIEKLRSSTKNERLRASHTTILDGYNEFKANLQDRLRQKTST
jgi:tetratricopeptide (TPR) repeat protein